MRVIVIGEAMSVRSHQLLAVLALAGLMSACSNGRGSVAEVPAGNSPPPSTPTPTPEPPPTPAPAEPPAEPTPPPEPPPPAPPPPPEPEPEPEPEGSPLAGFWKGRVVDQRSGNEREGVALVDLSGEWQLLVLEDDEEPQFVLHGNLCCESRINGEVRGRRYLDMRESDARIEVDASAGSLRGTFEFRGREYDFDLAPDDAYAQPLTLESLAGVYTRATNPSFDPASTLTLTIDADGALSGSHSNGCVFSGSVSIPNSSRNMIQVNVDLADCGGRQSSRRWNGGYEGLGILLRDSVSPIDGSTREDIFYHSVVGPTWLGPMDVGR
jgi:hypothetical protein